MSLFSPFVRYSQILIENHSFNLPHLSLTSPLGVTPLEFRRDFWHQKTRRIALSCGIKISPVGSLDQSQSTRVTDGQTDGGTDGRTEGQTEGQNYDSQDRASIAASRGKKSYVFVPHVMTSNTLHVYCVLYVINQPSIQIYQLLYDHDVCYLAKYRPYLLTYNVTNMTVSQKSQLACSCCH